MHNLDMEDEVFVGQWGSSIAMIGYGYGYKTITYKNC
jgi:hypothetical protein